MQNSGLFLNYFDTCNALVRSYYYQRAIKDISCKVLVVGGGTGGCSVAWRLSKKLNAKDILLLEPNWLHYYQPSFTLVAAGLADITQSRKPFKDVVPPDVKWLKDEATQFDPRNNTVDTACGLRVHYDLMVIAVGLKNDYHKIPGLKRLLDDPVSPVSTIYSPDYCSKCWCNLQQFQGGHAVFTFPKQAGKCSGAAQKIMYLAHDYWTRKKIQHCTSISYATAAQALFGVPKYAASLVKVAQQRDIAVNYSLELVEVTPKHAVFTGCGDQTTTLPYKLLHVTPPMSPPACLSTSELVSDGYLSVDKHTLQHVRYPDVFGLGDCTSTPNSKTAAAAAVQSSVVSRNVVSKLNGRQLSARYSGYGACPILTSYKGGIIAEFEYDKKICETFPFDQSKESRLCYYLQKNIFPILYWEGIVKGKWSGPAVLRKIFHPFGK
ncbi:unnamed protein product [Leptidea sinapis]|uniref:Sulfide:quinone oxidoreductase, mitochondrial n=1 Tax=Leptidea sinapis TaxID=189913 RepID=A0A5E4PKW1_9NEOP|nr:unnamed protein product [Leptidea sinapis]